MTTPALLVTGEAGVGKSRLIMETADAAGAHCTECRCSRYHQTTSLYAFRPVLEAACDIAEHDEPAARLSKLRARLDALDANGADLPFLTAAVQIPSSEIVPPPDVDPTRLRTLALDAAGRLVCAHLEGGPSILFVDDVHWADQSTFDLISELLLTRARAWSSCSRHATASILRGLRRTSSVWSSLRSPAMS